MKIDEPTALAARRRTLNKVHLHHSWVSVIQECPVVYPRRTWKLEKKENHTSWSQAVERLEPRRASPSLLKHHRKYKQAYSSEEFHCISLYNLHTHGIWSPEIAAVMKLSDAATGRKTPVCFEYPYQVPLIPHLSCYNQREIWKPVQERQERRKLPVLSVCVERRLILDAASEQSVGHRLSCAAHSIPPPTWRANSGEECGFHSDKQTQSTITGRKWNNYFHSSASVCGTKGVAQAESKKPH